MFVFPLLHQGNIFDAADFFFTIKEKRGDEDEAACHRRINNLSMRKDRRLETASGPSAIPPLIQFSHFCLSPSLSLSLSLSVFSLHKHTPSLYVSLFPCMYFLLWGRPPHSWRERTKWNTYPVCFIGVSFLSPSLFFVCVCVRAALLRHAIRRNKAQRFSLFIFVVV